MERITDGITNPAMKKYYDAVINAKSDDELKAITDAYNKEYEKLDDAGKEKLKQDDLLAINQIIECFGAVVEDAHQEALRRGFKDK